MLRKYSLQHLPEPTIQLHNRRTLQKRSYRIFVYSFWTQDLAVNAVCAPPRHANYSDIITLSTGERIVLVPGDKTPDLL